MSQIVGPSRLIAGPVWLPSVVMILAARRVLRRVAEASRLRPPSRVAAPTTVPMAGVEPLLRASGSDVVDLLRSRGRHGGRGRDLDVGIRATGWRRW